ncbi:MAG: ABC transporter permease [Bacilli bacterium]|nr:ABC transporter permease [Bacilli bacterium]
MNKNHEPLFHIVKRSDITLKKAILIRGIALLSGLVSICLLMLIFTGANPFAVIGQLFSGAFGTQRRFWILLRDSCLLLGVGLALVPAFKMKFWNLGGNGQILIGSLVSIICMKYMGEAGVSDPIIILVMIPSSIIAGAIWALIPAIFKAFFNTNESLFTLMMNYIAAGIVSFFLAVAVTSGSGTLPTLSTGNLPNLGNQYLLTIIVVILLLVIMTIYLKYTKQGYELTVVGESQNTARYVGINVKIVIIRTMVISGAICGLIGLLLAGSINHTINTESAKNMGFTAIMVAWLAKFNPLIMIATSFFITFLTRGMSQVQTAFGITNNSISDIIIGLVYFFIIGCEFFIQYQVIFIKKQKKKELQEKESEQ